MERKSSSKERQNKMEKEADAVKKLLNKFDIKIIKHKPTYTAVESSKERGIPLSQGVKSLILDLDGKIIEVLISGDYKIDLNKLKKYFNVKNAKLADKEVVFKKTNCEIGSVHPFCKIFNNIETYIDKSVLRSEKVDFSIGNFRESIEMKTKDFVSVLKVEVIDVGK